MRIFLDKGTDKYWLVSLDTGKKCFVRGSVVTKISNTFDAPIESFTATQIQAEMEKINNQL